MRPRLRLAIDRSVAVLSSCVDAQKLLDLTRSCLDDGETAGLGAVYEAALLANWLDRQAQWKAAGAR